MTSAARVRACLLFMFCFSATLFAQSNPGAIDEKSPLVIAAASDEKLRFTSPGPIGQIRIQIFSAAGETLFDSAWKNGNFFDWPIESQPLADGSYRCLIAIRDLEGHVTQRESTIVAQGRHLSIEQREGAEGLATVTLLAHDGTNGSVISTRGDLSFRFGDFLAGKDSERMRLTAEGALGIGTDKPQAPLDVNGLIRTSEGVMFPDGTILTSAEGLPGAKESGGVKRQRPTAPPVVGIVDPSRLPQSFSNGNRPRPRPTAGPDYQFKADTTGVHIGTTSAYGLDVGGDVTLFSNLNLPATASSSEGVIKLGGSWFAHAFGQYNTFVGFNSGNFTMSVSSAIGNTAFGNGTLTNNTTGSHNTAQGYYALVSNSAGNYNTAGGSAAMLNNTIGSENTAYGFAALGNNTTGVRNTAIGHEALCCSYSGSYNIAIGHNAGSNILTGSYNIDIDNQGSEESGTIRIGTSQTRAFIAGIRGVTTGFDAVPVMIDSTGQLGTMSSSRRGKYDISDMNSSTDGLMQLRPVTFRYLAHGDHAPLQYGLIAEEVAEVYPELVTRDKDGQVETVMYQFLAPMLLDEVQKQQRTIEKLEQRIGALEKLLK